MDLDWIREGLEKPGKNKSGLAKALGLDPAAITRMLKGQRRLQVGEIETVRRYLEAPTPPELRQEADVSQPLPGSALVGAHKDLPVYAAAEGGPTGMLVLTNEPIEWVKRPDPLQNVPRGYGVLIVGSSMVPEYEPGDIGLVHPTAPTGRDVTCLFQRHHATGEMAALVKRVVRWTANAWHVKQWNPPEGEAAEFELPRDEWQLVHRMVGRYGRR